MPPNDAAYNVKLVKRAIVNFASFEGQSRRSEFAYYWLAMLLAGVFIFALAFLLSSLAGLVGLAEFADRVVVVIAEICRALLFVPVFAIFARRLHDLDLSARGLIIMLPMLAPYLYEIASLILSAGLDGAFMPPETPGWLATMSVISWLIFFAFVVAPGTRGPNSFGPDPRDEDPGAARLPSAGADLSSTP